jgi:hypothetical protein
MKPYFPILILVLMSFNVQAKVHKWVDADGAIHYSDTGPGEDTETQGVRNVTGKDQAGATTAVAPKSIAEREAELRKAKLSKEEANQKKAAQDKQDEAKKSNCAAARDNSRVLEESPRIATYDANGERSLMDDSTRAQKLEEARKAVSENCN